MAEDQPRHTASRTVKLYAGHPHLSATVVGHLLIEAVLADLIRTGGPGSSPAPTFAAKVAQLETMRLLDAREADALRMFNRIRNKYAHRLDFALDFETAFKLVNALGRAGFDFSDETIYRDRQWSQVWYGIEGCVTEAVSSIFELVAWRTHERGGPDRFD